MKKIRRRNLNVRNKYKYRNKIFTILLEKYESIELAVAAYNAGIGTVDNWIEKGIIKEDGSDIENIPYKETNQLCKKNIKRL